MFGSIAITCRESAPSTPAATRAPRPTAWAAPPATTSRWTSSVSRYCRYCRYCRYPQPELTVSSGLPIAILPASSDRPRCAPGQRAEYPAYRQRPVVVQCRVLANPDTGLAFSWTFNGTEPDFEQEVRLGQPAAGPGATRHHFQFWISINRYVWQLAYCKDTIN